MTVISGSPSARRASAERQNRSCPPHSATEAYPSHSPSACARSTSPSGSPAPRSSRSPPPGYQRNRRRLVAGPGGQWLALMLVICHQPGRCGFAATEDRSDPLVAERSEGEADSAIGRTSQEMTARLISRACRRQVCLPRLPAGTAAWPADHQPGRRRRQIRTSEERQNRTSGRLHRTAVGETRFRGEPGAIMPPSAVPQFRCLCVLTVLDGRP